MSETMQYTQKYGLLKPSENDFFDVEHFNQNSDIVDGVLGDLSAQLGAFEKKSWVLNVSASWSGSSAPFSQTITAAGITTAMDVIVDVVLSGSVSEKLAQIEAMGMVSELVTGNGTVTLYCYDSVPTIAFAVKIREV